MEVFSTKVPPQRFSSTEDPPTWIKHILLRATQPDKTQLLKTHLLTLDKKLPWLAKTPTCLKIINILKI